MFQELEDRVEEPSLTKFARSQSGAKRGNQVLSSEILNHKELEELSTSTLYWPCLESCINLVGWGPGLPYKVEQFVHCTQTEGVNQAWL